LRRTLRRAASVGFGALALGLGGSMLAATTASASPNANVGGNASFSVSGTNLASTTVFNLSLPSGAACSDSGPDGGQYVSFLVPATTDLTSLTFHDFPGQADQGTGLITSSGSYLAQTNADATPAGQIDPDYAFGLEMAPLVNPSDGGLTVSGTELPTGTALIPTGQTSANYEAGIACLDVDTSPVTETDYWSVPLTFTVSQTDTNGFVWTPNPQTAQLPESPLAVGLPLGGGLILVGALFINRRRRRSRVAVSA
jgi:hypothetical protein